jgi:RNA polymerase sigma factor (sigma-70 family)
MSCESNALSVNGAFWGKAYSDNFATLCGRARRKLTNGNSYEAEDAVSEAFVRVMRYAQNPESIQSPVSYWWTAVKRVWAAQQDRLEISRTDHLEDMSAANLESLPSLRVDPEVLGELKREESQRDLRLKLGPLSLQEETLLTRYLEGYSLAEIATELNEDVKRTRFRWYRLVARQRYRFNKANAQIFGR